MSVWQRGKQLSVAPQMVHDALWAKETPNKKGYRHPGGTFHPLQVVHVGLPAFAKKKGRWQIRSEALPLVLDALERSPLIVDRDGMVAMLRGKAPMTSDFSMEHGVDALEGHIVLRLPHADGDIVVSAWCGVRAVLQLDSTERAMLMWRLGL